MGLSEGREGNHALITAQTWPDRAEELRLSGSVWRIGNSLDVDARLIVSFGSTTY
jgi:hypothetical protein